MKRNYWELVKEYKIFGQIESAYCRLLVFLGLMHLGLNCFIAGFRYLLITVEGYNR